jgi:hypothetical protein
VRVVAQAARQDESVWTKYREASDSRS